MDPNEDPHRLAKLAYAAYGKTTDYKNYQGKPMPAWDDLGEPIQAAWKAAADAVKDHLESEPAYDIHGRPAMNETGYVDRLAVGDNDPST